MKAITSLFKNMQAFSVLVGMACGAGIGLILFSYLVPHGPGAIAMFRKYTSRHGQEIRNKEEFSKLYALDQMNSKKKGNVEAQGENPYMMMSITSEHDFLVQMKLHHETALVMVKQLLALPNIHEEVKAFANGILRAQTNEITMMTDWTNSGR